MTQLLLNVVASVLLSALWAPIVYSQSSQATTVKKAERVSITSERSGGDLREEFSFQIKDFKFNHQSELNTLNISISYRYVVNIPHTAYPDFRLLAKDVETFLANYPNEVDYWEIVNKNLTLLLLQKYPAISSLTSEVILDPTRLDPYVHASRITRERKLTKATRRH